MSKRVADALPPRSASSCSTAARGSVPYARALGRARERARARRGRRRRRSRSESTSPRSAAPCSRCSIAICATRRSSGSTTCCATRRERALHRERGRDATSREALDARSPGRCARSRARRSRSPAARSSRWPLVEAWQVFARYVLNDSPGWTEPVALLLLNIAMMFGAAVGVRQRDALSASSLGAAAAGRAGAARCSAFARLVDRRASASCSRLGRRADARRRGSSRCRARRCRRAATSLPFVARRRADRAVRARARCRAVAQGA